MTFGYQMLGTFMSEKLSTTGNISLESLFKSGRERALATGQILSLHIDLENEKMGLMDFDPRFESGSDPALTALTEIQRRKRAGVKEENQAKDDEKEPKWHFSMRSFPIGIQKLYSPSGLELQGPVVYVHFYPDGTSDSLIFELSREDNRFLYLPRYNVSARYLPFLPLPSLENLPQ